METRHVFPCEICGGGKNRGSRGMCGTCYARERRHGFPSGLQPWHLSFTQHWELMDKPAGQCWIPLRKPTSQGYVKASHHGVSRMGHDLAYEMVVGPIPPGMVLDHTCHTNDPSCLGGDTCLHRACWNPSHLEPVTSIENFARGRRPHLTKARRLSGRTHCKHNHPWVPENLHTRKSGNQECLICIRLREQRRRALARGLAS